MWHLLIDVLLCEILAFELGVVLSPQTNALAGWTADHQNARMRLCQTISQGLNQNESVR